MVTGLTCERQSCLLGTDEPAPRLGWRPLVPQRAYRVVVASEERDALRGAGTLWDSGWVESAECAVEYAGRPLSPRMRCWFTVTIRGSGGAESRSAEPSWFETGMGAETWDSEWLQAPFPAVGPGRIFLREFDVDDAVRRARVYVAGLGYHVLRVNGLPCGSRVLDPAWTDYGKKICYVTHDVTGLLVTGRNVIAVMAAAGRYRQPVLNLQAFLELADGRTLVERTDHRQWWCPVDTPLRESSLYDGERHDARVRVRGWNAPLPSDPPGSPGVRVRPVRAEPPGGALVAQDVEPVRVVGELAAVAHTSVAGGAATVFDFGQNISGWARIRVQAPAGTEIRLRFSEALRDDGEVEMGMNRGARATDVYVTDGSGTEAWEPSFTYHGFRYAQVDASGPVSSLALAARVVRTDAARVGAFRCADERVNALRTACEWTEADNLHSVPTDCPQREERMGWLNDMTVRAESAVCTFDLNLLYAKWSEDIAQAQGKETGAITDVAPFDPYHGRHYGNRPADPVSSSYLLTAWLSYLYYGDLRTLQRRYPGFLRWYHYLRDQAEDGIVRYSYWGDWASAAEHAVAGSVGAGAVSAITPGALVSTSYVFYDARLLSRMAAVLGLPAESAQLARDAEEISLAFNREFYDPARRCYGTGSQACQAIPLALGLVPPEKARGAVQCLAADVRARGVHLSTGNLATRYVPEVLADHGLVDLAWDLVKQRSYPSWGYMLDHGATTVWERWEHIRGGGMSSHNHPMYATVSGWLTRYIGGIRPMETGPGFAELAVRPHVPRSLAWAEASLDTVRGTVRSSWKVLGDTVEFLVSVPPPSRARIELPGPRAVSWPAALGEPEAAREGYGPRLVWNAGEGDHRFVMER